IASHEQAIGLTRLSETHPRRRPKFSMAKKISTGSAGHKIRRPLAIGSFSIKPASRSLPVSATALLREYPFRSSRHDKTVAFSCKVLGNRRSRKSGATMRTELLRFNGAGLRDPAYDAWMKEH